ncbi:hypothetical protein SprV_0301132000 [Sparganum proliferum]
MERRPRQGGQVQRYKKDLKLPPPLKRLKINPANWEALAQDRRTCRRPVKTGAAILEAKRINAAKAKRRHANPNYRNRRRITPTLNGLQRVHDVNEFREPNGLLDTSRPSAAPGLHHPSSLLPYRSRLLRRQRTLNAPPPTTTTAILLLHSLNICRCGICHAH